MPMTALDFDTHKAVKNLQKAGFEEPAAEALIDTIDTAVRAQVATKADLELLEQRLGRRMDNLKHETQSDMDNFRSEIKSDMDNLRHGTKSDMDNLRHEIKSDMDNLRHGTKSDMDSLRNDFRSLGQETQARLDVMGERMDGLEKNLTAQMVILKRDVTIRLGGLMVVGIGVLAALETL